MGLLELFLWFYVTFGTLMAVHNFFLCGIPDIRNRTLLRERWRPTYQHAIGAVVVAVLMGLTWPWVIFGRR